MTNHAGWRLRERGITREEVADTIKFGVLLPEFQRGKRTWCFRYRGLAVGVDMLSEEILSVYRMTPDQIAAARRRAKNEDVLDLFDEAMGA